MQSNYCSNSSKEDLTNIYKCTPCIYMNLWYAVNITIPNRAEIFQYKPHPFRIGDFHYEDTISYFMLVKQYLDIIRSRLCIIHAKRYIICTPYILLFGNYPWECYSSPINSHTWDSSVQRCNCFWHQWLVQSSFAIEHGAPWMMWPVRLSETNLKFKTMCQLRSDIAWLIINHKSVPHEHAVIIIIIIIAGVIWSVLLSFN